MLKRNSIFIRILVPVIIVMLLQTLLISLVLFVNGTIKSLEDNAVEILRKNVENRSITLESMMIHTWSNLETLEYEVGVEIDKYLKANELSIDQVLGSREDEKQMLYNISGALLKTLRLNSSTGVYMFFIADEAYSEREMVCSGLYYRDLDPISTQLDYSDVIFLRGFIDIARKDRVQLDSIWAESFTLSPENIDVWRGIAEPWKTALQNPELSPVDFSYWNTPHYFNPASPLDSNEYIAYTRPVFWEGRMIGMLGIEMQVEQLKKYFPANDFDNYGKSGYMIVKYDQNEAEDGKLDCSVYAVTGSYIKRLIGSKTQLTLAASPRDNIYTIDDNNIEGVQIALEPLRLYNVNAPFSHEQWALASIGADNVLFASAARVSGGILYSSLVALLSGIVVLAFIVRISTKPLISIADQIAKSDSDDQIIITNSKTYETTLLCSTINEMRKKRRTIEEQLREERERYLFALESTADTFMEYDIAEDSFMLYYFSAENHRSELQSRITGSFYGKLQNGEICHPDDIKSMTVFFSARTTDPVKVRLKTSLFLHIANIEANGEYSWFWLKASHIRDNEGKLTKIIGVARDITKEKLEESVRLEASRRDSTTGLYNRDYGQEIVAKRVSLALNQDENFALSIIRIEDFDRFEAYYGRVFGAAVLMKFSWELIAIMGGDDLAVRLGNDEFMILFAGTKENEVRAKLAELLHRLDEVYVGENFDLRLTPRVGIALPHAAAGYEGLIYEAYQAAQHTSKTGKESILAFSELSPEEKQEDVVLRDKPVRVSLNISKEGIAAFAFDLFERTTDIQSAVNILLAVIGKMFSLHQIIICTYDNDFDTNHVANQWNSRAAAPYHSNIERVSPDDLAKLEALLDEDGTLLYDSDSLKDFGDGVTQLLCISPHEHANAFCCTMYENGVHMGRILFKSNDESRKWSDRVTHGLYEITKIISAQISINKSNSASRAKSEFLSRMSHEIRTPMNAIIGMTNIAKESASDPKRLEDCLDKIDFSAKHLLSLINDVLEMSRIESGKLQIQEENFSLSELVRSLDILMRPQLESKQITFEVNCKNQHLEVIGDEYRLRQVMVNLLGNAGKFTDSGGVITLSIEEIDRKDSEYGWFRFSVKDTGVGISQEDQPNIFKAFEQAKDESSVRKYSQGTGLGLTISSNIINAMNSKIELKSKLGEGSEFFFTLQLKLNPDQVKAIIPEKTELDYEKYLTGKRVLLVEDLEINYEIAAYILEQVGLQVEIAKDGQEAVDKFFASSNGYYDVILMDIQMPVMDGLTATRVIRKNTARPDARKIPIVAMTANAFDEDTKKSIESGMNGHIAKPIDNDKLYLLLYQLFRSVD